MAWASIVGQPVARRLLQQAVRTGRVAQAYLFTGPEGVGKRTTALELARSLNCQNLQPDGSACGVCSSCRKMAAVPPVHPDVSIVEPEGRFIKTEQIRSLQGTMYARPAEGRVRVAIIDGADRMNPESGNRLLKLLEEPPSYAVIILLTSNTAGVLPTILSRCQIVNFPPVPPEAVAQVLERMAGLDSQQARLFAALSGGSVGQAVRLSQDPAAAAQREETAALLGRLRSQDDFDLLAEAEALEKQKDELDQRLDWLLIWLRDALLVAKTGSDALVLNADRLQEVRRLAGQFGAESLLFMLGTVVETRRHIQRNANLRLALDLMMLRLGGAARANGSGTG